MNKVIVMMIVASVIDILWIALVFSTWTAHSQKNLEWNREFFFRQLGLILTIANIVFKVKFKLKWINF